MTICTAIEVSAIPIEVLPLEGVEALFTERALALFKKRLTAPIIEYNRLVATRKVYDYAIGVEVEFEQDFVRSHTTCILVAVDDADQQRAVLKLAEALNHLAHTGVWEHGVLGHGVTNLLSPKVQTFWDFDARHPNLRAEDLVPAGYRAFALVGLNGEYVFPVVEGYPDVVPDLIDIRRRFGIGESVILEAVL